MKRLDGASVRTVPYVEEETEFSVEFVKKEACRLFFPQGKSKMGNLEDFNIEIGNFSQEPINSFLDTEGKPCTYLEYLRDRGLYPSKSYIYLMTTLRQEKNASASDSSESEEKEIEERHSDDMPSEHCSNDSRKPDAGNQNTNTDSKNDPVKYCVVLEEDVDVSPLNNSIAIEYENITESHCSEVIIRSLSSCIHDAYLDKTLSDPFIQDEGLENFFPLEHGFTITSIHKGETCYLERVFSKISEDSEEKFFFPSWNDGSEEVIIHHPPEIWGYDEEKLILGVVTQFYNYPGVVYTWYNDGNIIKQGNNFSCITVDEPGVYRVEVKVGHEKAQLS